jgi:hypothetical protein
VAVVGREALLHRGENGFIKHHSGSLKEGLHCLGKNQSNTLLKLPIFDGRSRSRQF